ncbi:methionyl-tRNA formyltransferase [Cocleimonas sp. KMM 6892]|uniref:methionyl-tRNA formyltransferase n=1 Tax=unclassified Cocleimonas TaxID=2639732 RepID=UPI002DBBAF45|nr:MULTISPECIES: methionyl-tRNA formyltransferase [unclassified Cocleimonas]MEB8432564.1 methionyl-tRNA formyltransferase [Cocleimonas sp. KMM 6892]MEC4715423.1 methionyl-tRNA formyltransferase [Cocleimonas sp. KMM 6895]MEC4744958.1 methionyl-tRNA formyltransferase [Cocleimonas sp. KMM 6896]
MKIVYAGTPDFAVPALQSLINSGHKVVAVYTQPDRPAGRGRKVQFGPVKQVAVDAGIPVEQPLSLKDEDAQQILSAYDADVMIVAAYGLILPQAVLDMPRYGCLNIHGSLLPRWRGAAPIHRAIETGDTETGVTIMQMALGLDTGDMLLKRTCPITAEDTSQTIHDLLSSDGAEALLEVLDLIEKDELEPVIQDDALTTYAEKLNKAEAEIDWSQSAKDIDLKIRAFNPWPVAFTLLNGKPLRIYMSKVVEENNDQKPGTVISESSEGIVIATGDGVLSFSRLQLPGKKAMDVKDFINGQSLMGNVFPS